MAADSPRPNTHVLCASCGEAVEETSRYCPACGAIAPGMGSVDFVESEASALLASANLARIRRDWEQAIQKCEMALEAAPGDVSAHVLMGDIYDNQGRPRDAALWYQMAADLEPSNRTIAQRLQRANSRLRSAHPADASLLPRSSPSGARAPRLLAAQFVSGPGFRKTAAGIVIVAAAVFVVIILMAISRYADERRMRQAVSPVQDYAPRQAATGTERQTPPARPPAATSGAAGQSTASAPPQQLALSGTAAEGAFLSILRSEPTISTAGIDVRAAYADPRDKRLTVIFRAHGTESLETQKAILRSARTLALAAFALQAEVAVVTVRADANLSSSEGQTVVQTAFIADMKRSDSGAVPASDSLEELSKGFSGVQWHPAFPGSAPSGAAQRQPGSAGER